MPIVENRTPSHQNSNAFHAYIAISHLSIQSSNVYDMAYYTYIVERYSCFFSFNARILFNRASKISLPFEDCKSLLSPVVHQSLYQSLQNCSFHNKRKVALSLQNAKWLTTLMLYSESINQLLCWCWSVTCADPISPRRLANEVALSWSSLLSPLSSPWSWSSWSRSWSSALMLIQSFSDYQNSTV